MLGFVVIVVVFVGLLPILPNKQAAHLGKSSVGVHRLKVLELAEGVSLETSGAIPSPEAAPHSSADWKTLYEALLGSHSGGQKEGQTLHSPWGLR